MPIPPSLATPISRAINMNNVVRTQHQPPLRNSTDSIFFYPPNLQVPRRDQPIYVPPSPISATLDRLEIDAVDRTNTVTAGEATVDEQRGKAAVEEQIASDAALAREIDEWEKRDKMLLEKYISRGGVETAKPATIPKESEAKLAALKQAASNGIKADGLTITARGDAIFVFRDPDKIKSYYDIEVDFVQIFFEPDPKYSKLPKLLSPKARARQLHETASIYKTLLKEEVISRDLKEWNFNKPKESADGRTTWYRVNTI